MHNGFKFWIPPVTHSLAATTALLRQFSSLEPCAQRALRLEAAYLDEVTMSSILETDVLVGLKNDGLVGLENDGLVGLENNGLDREGLAMVVDDNCEFIFEGRSY